MHLMRMQFALKFFDSQNISTDSVTDTQKARIDERLSETASKAAGPYDNASRAASKNWRGIEGLEQDVEGRQNTDEVSVCLEASPSEPVAPREDEGFRNE